LRNQNILPDRSDSPLNNAPDKPTFALGKRPALLNQDCVADIAFVRGIMRHVIHPAANVLAVQLMPDFPFNRDHHCPVHAVAFDKAQLGLSGT
jgi:hypothetical protein